MALEFELTQSAELGAWFKSDFLSDFSELLDGETVSDGFSPKEAATLGSDDILDAVPSPGQDDDASAEALGKDWMSSCLSNGGAFGAKPDSFPGFPAVGAPPSVSTGTSTYPVSTRRCAEEDTMGLPSSWESSYSLQSSLGEYPSMHDSHLKSDDSLTCSYDPYVFLDQDVKGEPQAKKGKSKNGDSVSCTPKATLADRNRERQQRFRQRQKAKIETLESQVKQLNAEAVTLRKQKGELKNMFQNSERTVALLSDQLSQAHCHPSSQVDQGMPQISLTYCSPPLLLTNAQASKMDARALTKLWSEYVWTLSGLLKSPCILDQYSWSTETERLDAVTSELIQLMMHLWSSCPDFAHLKASGYMVLEKSHRRDESEDENWQQIAGNITFNTEQLAQLAHLRTTMCSKLQVITAARREAQASLIACVEETILTSRDLTVQHEKVKKVNESLAQSIKEESLLSRDFDFSFYKKVLTPTQRAIVIVKSYPRFPDTQAIANWIAACHGDKNAQSMMSNYTSSSATSYHSNSN